jgi:hypothetical protein
MVAQTARLKSSALPRRRSRYASWKMNLADRRAESHIHISKDEKSQAKKAVNN